MIYDFKFLRISNLRVPDDEGHLGFGAEGLEVGKVGMVVPLFDPHVKGSDFEAGFVNLRAATQQFGEQQTVFAAAEADENMVVVGDELIVSACFMETLREAIQLLFECYLFRGLHVETKFCVAKLQQKNDMRK